MQLRSLLIAAALLASACSETPQRRDAGDIGGIHLLDARRDRAAPELGDLLAPDLVAPGSDRCTGAAPAVFSGGKASVKGSTAGATNEYGSGIRCGGATPLLGPQRYHRFVLKQGLSYRIELRPEFAAALVLASSCGQNAINTDCGSGGATGAYLAVSAGGAGALYFTPSSTGDYRIAVDSSSPSAQGGYELTVEEFAAPPNASCASAQALGFAPGGKATVQGSTLGAKNEFEGQLRCRMGVALDGPQVYYSIDLSAGSWYRISLEPTFTATLYVANAAAGCKPANLEVDCSGLTGSVLPNVAAGGKGQTAFAPIATGSYLLAVESAVATAAGSFTLEVEALTPAAGTICAKAVDLGAPPASGLSVQGDTASSLNDLGAHSSCSGLFSPLVGPQRYYLAQLKQGTYQLALKPSFAALLLVGQGCPTLPIDCGSAGLSGLGLAVAAGKTGATLFSAPSAGSYVIAVDSTELAAAGPFTLDLREHVPPQNGGCGAPKTLPLASNPTLEVASTGPLANDLVGVSCGATVGPFAGPQAYHRVSLKANATYTIELEPEPGFDPALYALPAATACDAAAVSAACQGLVSDAVGVGIKEKLTLTPPADGDYLVVVDSWSPSEVGGFTLSIAWK